MTRTSKPTKPASKARAAAKPVKNLKRPAAKPKEAPKSKAKSPRDDDASTVLAMTAVEAAFDKKCLAPLLIDLSAEGSYADYILIVSGRSDRHVQSVADGVKKALKEMGRVPIGLEGNGDGQWSLIDYGDLVVHVFYHPLREHYDLEGMWSDAPRVPLDIPADSQVNYADSYV